MMMLNVNDEKNLVALVQLLISGQQDKIILTKDDKIVAKIVPEKEMTDAEKIQEWARLNKIKKDDEVVTTDVEDNPVIMKKAEFEEFMKTQPRRESMFGIAKDKIKLAPDFDEWFDAMDAEILEDFSDDPDCEF